MPRVSVILPMHNEAATVAEIVRRVRASGCGHEIVAVDDGSTDGTAGELEKMKSESERESERPGAAAGSADSAAGCRSHAGKAREGGGAAPLRVMRHATRRGKGAAIRTGLAAVTGEIVLIQDADLEYDPADYPALLAPFADERVQAVYGSRNLRENPRSTAAFYWGGRMISVVANLLYGSRLSDIATGYKAIRTPLMRELGLTCDGFEFCPEVTARLLRRGVEIHEVPIRYRPRTWAEGKKIRARDGVVAVWTLVRMRVG